MPLNRGFSLIELMVVLAISGAVTVGTTSVLMTMTKGVMSTATKTNGQSLVKEIEQATSSAIGCTSVLAGQNFAPDSDGRLNLNLTIGGRAISAGTVANADGIKVAELYLDRVRSLQIRGSSNLPVYVGDMFASLQRNDGSAVQLRKQRVGRLYMEVSGQSIVSCSSNNIMPDILSASCIQMGGAFSKGNCDMSPYANAVVKTATDQVDTQLYGDYNVMLKDKITTETNRVMADVVARGNVSTAAYTNNAIAAVNANLNQNLNQVAGATSNLNQNIATTVAQASAGANDAQSTANSVYQAAITAYGKAINAYNAAVAAAGTANAAANATQISANTAANSLSYGLNSQNNAYAISNVAFDAMNVSTGAVNSGVNAVNVANDANNQANNAVNVANGANLNASGSVSYSSSANDQANNSVNYANGVSGVVNNSYAVAADAANQASYAAGVANGAMGYANYAAANPPTVTNVNTTVVTYIPRQPAPTTGLWSPDYYTYYPLGTQPVCFYPASTFGPGLPCSPVGSACFQMWGDAISTGLKMRKWTCS